uniref:DDE Tnp4 domain-containing protein n=1 Tax=Lactuca sativa TaxID=4236 RepID=A0A9R1X9Y5_LACSA|nr:hypothetical protein LSAT_V11C600324110 [Lactuca sativa]
MDTINVHDVNVDTPKVKVTNRLHWDPHTFKIFTEECMTELKSGNRPEFKYYVRVTRLEMGISTDPMRNLILASKEWWDEKIKEDKEYAKFKDKNLDVYQTYYEALFRDTVAVGDKAKVPCEFGNGSTPDDVQFVDITDGKVDTDEVRLFEDVEPFLTYDSSSMKRRGKKLTPRSDNKRKLIRKNEGKNEGKSMANSSYEEKLDTVFDVLLTRSTQPSKQTTQSTTTEDCMAIVSTFPEALEVFLKKPTRQNFMVPKTNETKMEFLKRLIEKEKKILNGWYVIFMASDCESDNSYDSDDLCDEIEENEEIQTLLLCGLAVKGLLLTHKSKYVCRRHRSSSRTGSMLINEILNDHESRCYELFKLQVPVFNMLWDIVAHYGLKKSRCVSIEESLRIFLLYLAHACGNRLVQEFFNHFGERIHKHFHKVLDVVVILSKDIIKPNANYNETIPEHILNKPRLYWCHQLNTHEGLCSAIIALLKILWQHVMSTCALPLCGLNGKGLHMTREFSMKREGDVKLSFHFQPMFYLVDAEYPNTKGYLAPYKGSNIHYHIPDFGRGQTRASREPKGFKEKFNYYHSSLCNLIERTFGVWEARWVLLRDMHVNLNFKTQVKIVLASMAIHNYVRMSDSGDATFQIAQEQSYILRNDEGPNDGIEPHDEVSSTQRRSDDMYMSAVRDMIAGQIFSRSNTRARNGNLDTGIVEMILRLTYVGV